MHAGHTPIHLLIKAAALPVAFLASTLAFGAGAHAAVLNIDGTQSGCTACDSYAHGAPGQVTGLVGTKVQLFLAAGTHTITNAATVNGALPGANPAFTAWTYNAPWTWGFGAADDATGTIVLEDYIMPDTFRSQAAAAGATGVRTFDGLRLLSATTTAGFTDTFSLAAATTLDFYILDYDVLDNGGGVAIGVDVAGGPTSVPEPASLALLGVGVAGLLAPRRRRLRAREPRDPGTFDEAGSRGLRHGSLLGSR